MNNLITKQINEVEEIERMFIHLKESAKQTRISFVPFKFFGFPETTSHYHIYRMIKLDDTELKLKWRYRDQDENGLARCLKMLEVYKIIVSKEMRATLETLTSEQLEILANVSNVYQNRAA